MGLQVNICCMKLLQVNYHHYIESKVKVITASEMKALFLSTSILWHFTHCNQQNYLQFVQT